MCVCSTWSISPVWLWMLVCWGPGWCEQDGTVPHLSKEDVLLLADDEVPKCFTRTQFDLTCFWEETSSKSYDFVYSNDESFGERRCNLTLQWSDEGSVLHVCYFPNSDVFLFTHTHIRVLDPSTNRTIYSRSISVEDQGLLDPPENVSLHHTGQAGQLWVVWHMSTENFHLGTILKYEIRYSSQSLGERTALVSEDREWRAPVKARLHTLTSLAPGEVVRVQFRVRPQGNIESSGHWSHWSAPVYAMVPQSADDISLWCHTSDLHNVTCQWNEKANTEHNYTLFYKMDSRGGEEVWSECQQDGNTCSCCRFQGNESSVLWVRLSAGPVPLSPTFYTKPFRLNSIVRTAPPGSVSGESEGSRLDVRWETPLPALSVHLMYQVRYQARVERTWKLVTLQGPETSTSLDVQRGSWYSVQVRARPNGSVYAGYWSDWSLSLSVEVPSDIGALLILCIPLVMLLLFVVFIAMFSRYLSKLKRYLWPPVPNLDKVLQGFLTEINRQTWDPPYNAKQCVQETPASVVEVVSESDAPGEGKLPEESSALLSPETRGRPDGEKKERSEPRPGGVNPEVSGSDYVTLNAGDAVPGPHGNEYLYDEDVVQRGHVSPRPGRSSPSDILNHSYLLLEESPGAQACQDTRATGHLYANLDEDATLTR